ncbi:methyltransferase type 11 [Deinococcus aetherius]|uniref:Methyltransferase type 11 n=1 Tax=Deinococcus aetherius TaxID=200252 RepID=A0ABN6RAQ4_9DEIO|nr:class I SAM-dependent methyltransferase [Deinococcus aetherius]BDP40435.1 methyltransferase type 11 [Deinococcus aetherius]
MENAEFTDPRLVPVYDALYPWGPPEALFLALANETPAVRVADVGCGTGRITLALAEAGHTVTGVDPARASLDAARAKPGAERVVWLEGKADVLPSVPFDLALMTSHVAQFIVDDAEWDVTLAHLRRALVPGGRLIFDSRDPRARGWEAWNPTDSREEATLPDGREVVSWTEVTEVAGELVTFLTHYIFSGGKEELFSLGTLRFRPEETLRSSLERAGFEIEHIFGGWQREPVGQGDGEFIVIARAK